MRAMRFRGIASLAVAAGLVVTAAACGSGSPSTASGGGKLTTVNVGVLPIIDDVALYVGLKEGLFRKQGLDVKPVIIANGALTSQEVLSGKLQFAFNNYVTMILAAQGGAPLRLVADGCQTTPGVMAIMVPKDSPIHRVRDLAGKTLAVNAPKNIGPLMVESALKAAGVPAGSVKLTTVQFPDMSQALRSHTVDAAWMVEPFVSLSGKTVGARLLADTASGAMADFPVSGWETSAQYAQQNQKVVAAFRKAITQASADAANRSVVEQVAPAYIKGMTRQTASKVHVMSFPTAPVTAARLQRVAEAMRGVGLLTAPFDVRQLLLSS